MTKEMIEFKIMNDNQWLLRGVLAIWKWQTVSEQDSKSTKLRNGYGFTTADAPFLSSISEQINRGRILSEKQIFVTRKKMVKYCGQLEQIANGKQAPVLEMKTPAEVNADRRFAAYLARQAAASKNYSENAFRYCSR